MHETATVATIDVDTNGDGADDNALAAAAQANRQAFASLYERYVAAIFRYCYHRLGDREAAEDATSLTFTKALDALPRYRPSGSFRSWLFAIAHNTVTDDVRRRRPVASLSVDVPVGRPAPRIWRSPASSGAPCAGC